MDLQYYKTFNQDTSQGIVGLLKPLRRKTKETQSKRIFKLNETIHQSSSTDYFFVKDDPTYPIYVFKIPKEINTLMDHELKVSKDMEQLSTFLPNFNRILEVKRNVKCHISDKKQKDYNPFEQYNCIRDVSIIEYIPSNITLLDYIKKTNFSGSTDALIYQLILALFIAQQEKNFTHYDLHLDNILLRRCLQRTFFWYKFLYEGVVINRLVYTNGYFPVIFDYGFAYSKGLEGTSYNNSLFFTNKGYTPFMFDEVNDFKTLMVRLAYEKNCPKKFKKFTDENFLNSNKLKFKLSPDTGWTKTTISSVAHIVCKKLKKTINDINSIYKDSFIYKELDNVVELFGILIKLPIGPNDFKNKTLHNVVNMFLIEWQKIDIWFSNTAAEDKLNIIKKILDTVNNLIVVEYEHYPLTRNRLASLYHNFKLKMFEIFDSFGDFVNVEDLNYDKLLSSIIDISNFIEHTAYTEIQRYKKLFNFNTDGWTLFNSIETLVVPTESYNFNLNDCIVLFDCVEKSTSSFDLIEEDIIEALNRAPDIVTQLALLENLPKYDYN